MAETIEEKIKKDIKENTGLDIQGINIEKDIKKEIDEIKDFVTKGYQEILLREPDIGGLNHYIEEIRIGRITEDKFLEILKESEEYKVRFIEMAKKTNPSKRKGINFAIPNPVRKTKITPSPIYSEPPASSSTNLVYCMMGGNRLHEIKDYIPIVLPYIDGLVYVDSHSTDGSLEFMKDLSEKNGGKIIVIEKDWEDKFSVFRNHYLDYLRSIGYKGWTIISDSISGDRCTTILNEDGQIEVLSFEELFNKYSSANWDTIIENGKELILNLDVKVLSSTKPKIFIAKKIDDLRFFPDDMDYLLTDKQIEIINYYRKGYSFQKIGEILNVHFDNIVRTRLRGLLNKTFISIKPEWCKVSKIIRHRINKDLVQITTKHGGTCVTRDHSLIGIKISKSLSPIVEMNEDWYKKTYKGLYAKIAPDDFIKNDQPFIAIHHIKNDKIIEEIDLAKYINDWSKLYIEDEYICYYRNYDDKTTKIKRFYSGEDLKLLCEILGSFISEGSTSGNQTFSIANNDKNWLDRIKENLEKITIDCKFKFDVEDNGDYHETYHLRSYQNLLIETFENLCGDDASRKKIPNFIYNIPTEYKQIFIENLMKGDGWENKEYFLEHGKSLKYAENRFEYTTTSLKLASGLSTLLKILDINHHIYRGTNNIGVKYYVLGYKMTYKEKIECNRVVESINSENKEIYVYDLEVESSNIFVDSLGSILLHNTDEHFPVETLSKLRELIQNAKSYSGVAFRAYDITIDDNDRTKTVSESLSNYWKRLMFRYHQDLHYEGEPHETLTGHKINWVQTELIYKHSRSKRKIYERATENFFISNSNRYSVKWGEFRRLCTNNDIMRFTKFFDLYKKGTLPKELEDWIYNHRNDDQDSGDSEVREQARLYFEILHPEKLKNRENAT